MRKIVFNSSHANDVITHQRGPGKLCVLQTVVALNALKVHNGSFMMLVNGSGSASMVN